VSTVRDGLAVSEGISFGPIRLILSGACPRSPTRRGPRVGVEEEVERFADARELGTGPARGDPGRDRGATRHSRPASSIRSSSCWTTPEVVDGTVRYIRENRLTAARAFYWRMLELQAQWVRTSNPMVLDRLNDLEDLMVRVLHRLLELPEPTISGDEPRRSWSPDNLTPSLTVQMDPEQVLGIATDLGTRTSHWAILARSLEIPAVAGIVDLSDRRGRPGGDPGRAHRPPRPRPRRPGPEVYRERRSGSRSGRRSSARSRGWTR
jgi:phosphoenolpyruvate-protein kinase (PTS system EI component)